MPRSEARRREPEIPYARGIPKRQTVLAANSGRVISAVRFARSMTTRCGRQYRTILPIFSASSARHLSPAKVVA